MSNVRLIPRLDIKGPNLIKGIHLEGLRVIGSPNEFAIKYYENGADELLYMDTVASLYGRNTLSEIVKQTTKDVFIPLTVGGGIRSTDDVHEILSSGADKVAVNTEALKRPEIITEISKRFGSQCMVISIEAKKTIVGKWEAYSDNGREHSGKDVVSWAREAVERGAGEILLTSVDMEGTRKGFDLELIKQVSNSVSVPVIASGGMGTLEHAISALKYADVYALAMADVLHYGRFSLSDIRSAAKKELIKVREV